MFQHLRRRLARRRRRRAQGMTEYIIIVGLIAILLISAVTKFKDALGGSFDAATGVIEDQVTAPIQEVGQAPGGK